MKHTHRLVYISLLAAMAVVLSIFERSFPVIFPFAPGAKLGLPNIIIIVSLFTLRIKDSFWVFLMRIFIATLLGGTFSTFLYSFMGGLFSFSGMILMKYIGPRYISLIGLSVVGGMLHNFGQLIMASLIAKTFSIMLYLPILSAMGILSGILTGWAAYYLLKHVHSIRDAQLFQAKADKNSELWGEVLIKENRIKC